MDEEKGTIKCVVWDRDNTLWEGILLEADNLKLNDDAAVSGIKTLDQRGILNSIASKNEHFLATERLTTFGINHYFLYPQINSISIKKIADFLNIGIDSSAFVDDRNFELDEVKFSLPAVTCISSSKIPTIPDMSEMNSRFVTQESAMRRKIYQRDIKRKELEKYFNGSLHAFLASLDVMVAHILIMAKMISFQLTSKAKNIYKNLFTALCPISKKPMLYVLNQPTK